MGRSTHVRFGALNALIGAPFVVLLGLLLMAFVASAFDGANSLFYFIFAIGISAANAIATWTVGLAWHVFVMRALRKPPADLYSLPGAWFGWVIMRVAIDLSPHGTDDPISWSAIAAFFGMSTATIVWLIRRPDRDLANPPTSAP